MNNIKMISYYNNLENYRKVDAIVEDKINSALDAAGIHTMQVAHRLKDEKSVYAKMLKKPDKYSTATDMTDIVGFRIICYLCDQIDDICRMVEDTFDIDTDNYVDKSKILSPNTFGYLSVHYICMLKPSPDEYPDELCGYKFEIQIRTVLQHTWAEIEHDLGYKNEFGVPKHVRREFSRMASLLEIADEGFVRIKDELNSYGERIREKLKSGDVAGVAIDSLSLREFMKYNQVYLDLITDIASITGAEISDCNADSFIDRLDFLDIKTLGDLIDNIREYRDIIDDLAQTSLSGMEIEDMAVSTGLYYLCRAKLIKGDYSKKDIRRFLIMSNTKPSMVEKRADSILNQREKYAEQ